MNFYTKNKKKVYLIKIIGHVAGLKDNNKYLLVFDGPICFLKNEKNINGPEIRMSSAMIKQCIKDKDIGVSCETFA
jgi:hypothetical protein